MKKNFLTYIGIFCFGIMAQMIFNLPNRPFWNDGNFYRGDIVIHVPEKDDFPLYTNCEQGKVLTVDKEVIVVRWENCENPEPQFSGILYEFHVKSQLKQKYLK